MERELRRYLGRVVELIYMDRHGKFSKRRVEVRGIRGDLVKVFCLERQAPRLLRIGNVLAVLPVILRVG